jgi:3D (Asp-Asp-Asp) domain-containing protein
MVPALASLLMVAVGVLHGEGCRPEPAPYRITGYTRTGGSPFTYDGTSVWTDEKVVAASENLPIGTLVQVRGLDYTYRVADRGGGLESRHIDVLVDSVSQAYQIEEWVGGRYAEVCIVRWGPEDPFSQEKR